MKTKLIYLLLLSLVLFFAACSEDDDGPTDSTEGDAASAYYPGNVGTTYNYEGQATDSSGNTMNYQREAEYTDRQTQDGTDYIVQSNTITLGPQTTSGEFFFRTSNTGMFIYIDPAVFQEILDSSGIDPGSITISADPEIRLIAYPFDETPSWDAFVVEASAGFISLNLLELQGNYLGQEQVTIQGSAMTAEKIEYTITIKIPQSIDDILNPETVELSAYAWFVKDVGLVKIEGSNLVLGALGSGELDFEDEDGTAVETLVSYSIVE